jgi:hypothetical protein
MKRFLLVAVLGAFTSAAGWATDPDTVRLGRVDPKELKAEEDTEQVHCRHRGYYGGYYGGYYSSFRYYSPGYAVSYYSYYAPPIYYYPAPRYFYGYYYAISGATAPTVALGAPGPESPPQPAAQPNEQRFRYDGGPPAPVAPPLANPKADPAPVETLKINLPATTEKPKSKFTAYGEKR